MTREHYEVLNRLLALGRQEVRLFYSTNFSALRFMHWDLMDLWRQFQHVTVAASLDGSGRRGDYLRTGQRWENVIANRLRQKDQCPHVSFCVSSTLSNMNSLHLPDFHREWIEAGLIGCEDTRLNILLDPPHYRLSTLPEDVKDVVQRRYDEHIRYVSAFPGCEFVAEEWESAIRFMRSQNRTDRLEAFRFAVAEMDAKRGESFWHTFPELAGIVRKNQTAIATSGSGE
jgi:hypothetical protein